MNLLLEPHQDDAALFASFICLRFKPVVLTVLRSQLQEDRGTGITNEMREAENDCAMRVLGCEHETFTETDANPDWSKVERYIRGLANKHEFEMVFAPAVEEGGHEQHNAVGQLALNVWPNLQPYLTYRRGFGRTEGQLVLYEPEWMETKMRALACYESQINEPTTAFWFAPPLSEYVP